MKKEKLEDERAAQMANVRDRLRTLEGLDEGDEERYEGICEMLKATYGERLEYEKNKNGAGPDEK